MAKTLKDLLLALLNATLLLLALCLFLAWKTASTVNDVTASFASNLQLAGPLRDEVRTMREEVSGLRADLAALASGAADGAATQRIAEKIDALNARMETAQGRLGQLSGAPEELIDHAIETAADRAVQSVAAIRGCVPAS